MNILKINNNDFSNLVSSLRVGYETLVSDTGSGRNANGDMVIDVINRKAKLYITLRHTFAEEMENFLTSIEGYVVTVSFLDPKSNYMRTITAYTSTPEPEYYTAQTNKKMFKPLNINFIEL